MFKKKISWKKHGLFIKPQKDRWWSLTHAMIPTPEELEGGIFRVYYSGRNDNNQSYITWADVDLNEPYKVKRYASTPTLSPGELGCFDDNGVTPSCLVNIGNKKYFYYIGWNPGSTVRMHLFGGLSISNNEGKTFNRWSRSPVIERCPSDPFLNTAPWVVKTEKNFRMYYVSGCGWRHKDLPRYNIKMGTSTDGKNWKRDGHVCIDFKDDSENALARPYVIFDDGVWKMWFSHKGTAYRLGYAESEDGIIWHRRDEYASLNVSDTGWDSEMIEYAAIVTYKDQHFMFYNGNNYGYDGIGLAVEE
jgi:predicted GH43/DUF377 family glycosyl hydrolase